MDFLQEENNDIEDYFRDIGLHKAFELIENAVSLRTVHTNAVKTYCNETVKLLKKFVKKIEELEKDEIKNKNKKVFSELLKNTTQDF